jgi:hypothetical protein
MYFGVVIWLFLVIGGLANIWQCITRTIALDAIGDMSGLLLAKIISILLGPVGSIWGLIDLF